MKFLQNIGKNAMLVGYGIGGGALGRVLTKNVATKVPFIKDQPKLQPALALLAGAAMMDMKGDLMHYGGHGMASVAGVDTLSNYVPALGYTESVADEITDEMADELTDILEDNLSDDVSSAEDAMSDDVSSGSQSVNDDVSDDLNDDLSDDLNGSDD